jgi:hypothetical protein
MTDHPSTPPAPAGDDALLDELRQTMAPITVAEGYMAVDITVMRRLLAALDAAPAEAARLRLALEAQTVLGARMAGVVEAAQRLASGPDSVAWEELYAALRRLDAEAR